MRRSNSLYYLFLPFFAIYILFLIIPIFRTLTFQSLSYIMRDTSSGILQSLEYTYLLALVVSLISIGFSIPYVYFVSRNRHIVVRSLDALLELPIMIPHTVVGIMMLITFLPTMPIGKLISSIFPSYQFLDTVLAVVVTLLFLSSAYAIRAVQISYSSAVMKYEDIGRTLGMSPFYSYLVIGIPMMGRALLRGLVLSWARSISEVGSLLIVAFSILPSGIHIAGVLIFYQFTSGSLTYAVASSVILIFTGLVTLLVIKVLERER